MVFSNGHSLSAFMNVKHLVVGVPIVCWLCVGCFVMSASAEVVYVFICTT